MFRFDKLRAFGKFKCRFKYPAAAGGRGLRGSGCTFT
jgi:hypothetical protein